MLTVNVNAVVWDRDPAVPVTMIVDDPAGVDTEVVTVTVDEHVGLHDPGENEAVAPPGRPEAAKDTACVVPETSVAVIVLVTDCPCTTVLFPPLESEKSKGVVAVLVRLKLAGVAAPAAVAITE